MRTTKKIMVYVSFDKKLIGYRENNLDWEAGEVVRLKGEDMMVYANFDLNHYGLKVFKWYWKKGIKKTSCFHSDINYNIEQLIKLTSIDDFGRKLEKQEEIIRERQLKTNLKIIESLSKVLNI